MSPTITFRGRPPSRPVRAELFRRARDLAHLGDALLECEILVLRSRVHPELLDLRILGRTLHGRVVATRLIEDIPGARHGLEEVFDVFHQRMEAQCEVRRELDPATAPPRGAPHTWFG